MNKELIKISDLFELSYGNNFELINLVQCDNKKINSVPFVSRTEKNNGVSAFVEEMIDATKNLGHTITVAVSGSVLSSFYQPIPYYTGFHVLVLTPKAELSVIEMLFYAHCISLNKYKYNYGRQANKTLKDILIPKSITKEDNFKLNQYFQSTCNKITRESQIKDKYILDTNKWKYFSLNELFEIEGSETTPLLALEDYGIGNYPYVTTQATNNGIGGLFDYFTEFENVLTIDSAVYGYCSYQYLPFSASDHVEKLIPKFQINKYIAMFLTTVINLEQYRYNYGRKCSQTRMNKSKIKLPSKNNKPDWEFMELYIKSLPNSASL